MHGMEVSLVAEVSMDMRELLSAEQLDALERVKVALIDLAQKEIQELENGLVASTARVED